MYLRDVRTTIIRAPRTNRIAARRSADRLSLRTSPFWVSCSSAPLVAPWVSNKSNVVAKRSSLDSCRHVRQLGRRRRGYRRESGRSIAAMWPRKPIITRNDLGSTVTFDGMTVVLASVIAVLGFLCLIFARLVRC